MEDARWSCLPAPLVERVMQLAFQDSSRAFRQWLCMSLVCRYTVRGTETMRKTCKLAVDNSEFL